MKKTFTTVDILAIVDELKESVVGLRVNQIYDIDHKTYLIKLQKPDHKVVLLLESSSRIHTTDYEWPKSPAPSGFSMKLRKHLRNKRLESVEQLGVDRIVDLTFGSAEAAHHLIVELYDRGNIVLTDGEYNILNVLRPRKEGEDTKITVSQKYPLDLARKARAPPTLSELEIALNQAKENLALKKILNPLLDCGGGLLDHELLNEGFPLGVKKGKTSDINICQLHEAVQKAQLNVINKCKDRIKKGYIIKKLVKRTKENGESEDTFLFEEFHPQLYVQHKDLPYDEFTSFNKACDEFFSKLEANELDKKAAQKEKEALKKLENVRRDHEKRLLELKERQEEDRKKGQLVELNQQLVEGAILVVRSALANQIDWNHIQELLDEAQGRKDPIACAIRELKLNKNTITLWLSDPYDCDENDMFLDSDEEREEGRDSHKMRPMAVDINLDLSALANARSYYTMKRQAAKKEQKTIDASFKAIKSAEKKTQQTLKEVNTIASINKARRVHWFEKFLWFISSESYLVIGGRDSQQNEQVVKRHLKPKDVYVHADLHGAASVVIKNPTGAPVPPRTLHEAGIMALCYSRAWDEKVITSAWWVWGQQVSKTAPAGEYLTTGAFMVRGKKNFLPPSHLVYGFGFLFRLEESSIQRHEGERRVRCQDEEFASVISDALEKLSADQETEVDIPIDEEEDDSDAGVGPSDETKSLYSILEETAEKSDAKSDVELAGMVEKLNDDGHDDRNDDDEDDDIDQNVNADNDNTNDDNETNEAGKEDLPQELLVNDHDKKESASGDDMVPSDNFEEFPDIELRMSHLTGDQFTLKAKLKSTGEGPCSEEGISRKVFLGDSTPVFLSKQPKKNKEEKKVGNKEVKREVKTGERETEPRNEAGNIKRGKKGKLKKMKKYKDQDEEERELRMQLLQSAGAKKSKEKSKRGETGRKPFAAKQRPALSADSKPRPGDIAPKQALSQEAKFSKNETERDANTEENDDEEVMQVPDDLSVLNALTAVPLPEDELLYAVPVCAPYTSMTNYKFKIKLTPGIGKKGKACKTAISLFLGDKTSSNREKDLLRAIKDHDLAKNMPGKVKVSAPNMSKIKK